MTVTSFSADRPGLVAIHTMRSATVFACCLAVVVFVNTVVSLFYYLRGIAPVYGRGEPVERTMAGAFNPAAWSAGTAVVTAALSLALEIGAGACEAPSRPEPARTSQRRTAGSPAGLPLVRRR